MRFVQTEIDIDAPRDVVYAVLVDFEKYPQWGSFIRAIDGAPEVGREITEHLYFRFLPFRVLGKSFVERTDPGVNFTWRGSFVHSFHRLGNGTHSFALEENAVDCTRLIHREEYRGALVPLTFALIRRIAEPHFRIMDKELKRRAERIHAASR